MIGMLLAWGMFLFSAVQLWNIYTEYKNGEEEYDNVRQYAMFTEAPKQEELLQGEESVGQETKKLSVDFENLKSMNPDTVGWIHFDGDVQIDYPLVQGTDNEKYLKTTFEGKKNSAGCLFIDFQNDEDFSDRNTIIYGHNMKNGSMLGRLRKYKNTSFCEENPYFHVYTPNGSLLIYEIFAVSILKDSPEYYEKYFENDQKFLDYVERIRGQSLYFKESKIKATSKIVSLSTCTNVTPDERLLVQGVLISGSINDDMK